MQNKVMTNNKTRNQEIIKFDSKTKDCLEAHNKRTNSKLADHKSKTLPHNE